MRYFISKFVKTSFDATLGKVTEELKKEGFGILTEIDIKETLKEKLDVDFENYKILGACNPVFAYRALLADKHIGALLPCNVVVRELKNKQVQVSVINPILAMRMTKNYELSEIASEIIDKLKRVLDNV